MFEKDKTGMEAFMEKHGKAVYIKIQEFLPGLRKTYNVEGVQAVVDNVWGNIDLINKFSGLDKETSCYKGCNICCNGNIHISSLEASYITSYIKQ